MRNQDLCKEFVNQVSNIAYKEGSSMRVAWDGKRLFSYGTCIGECLSDGSFILNATKYSTTTSKHQTYLKRALEGHKVAVTTKWVPMGTTELIRYAI